MCASETQTRVSHLFLSPSILEFSISNGNICVRHALLGDSFQSFSKPGPPAPQSFTVFPFSSNEAALISLSPRVSLWIFSLQTRSWRAVKVTAPTLQSPKVTAAFAFPRDSDTSILAFTSPNFTTLIRIDVSGSAACASLVTCGGEIPRFSSPHTLQQLRNTVLAFGRDGTWRLDTTTNWTSPKWTLVTTSGPAATVSTSSGDSILACEPRRVMWRVWRFFNDAWTPEGAFKAEGAIVGAADGFISAGNPVVEVTLSTPTVLLDDLFRALKRKQRGIGATLDGKDTEVRGLQSDIEKLAAVRRKMRAGGRAPANLFTEERVKALRGQVVKLREQFVREAKEVLANHARQLNPPSPAESRLESMAENIEQRIALKKKKFKAKMAALAAEAETYERCLQETPERLGTGEKTRYEEYLKGLREVEVLRKRLAHARQKKEQKITEKMREARTYSEIMTEIQNARARLVKYTEKEKAWEARLRDAELEVACLSVLNEAMKRECTVEKLAERRDQLDTQRKERKRKIAGALKASVKEKRTAVESLRQKLQDFKAIIDNELFDGAGGVATDFYDAIIETAKVIAGPL